MIHSSRPWLPEAAIAAGARAAPLRQVVADWSAKWFAGAPALSPGEPVPAGGLDLRGGAAWELADGLALLLAADAEPALIARLFGARPDAEPLTPVDQSALQAVVDACLADLRARLATAFRLPADAPWRPALADGDTTRRWVWRVEVERGAALLRIAVDEALITRRVRSALPPAARGNALGLLAAALTEQAIEISALVGRCRLTTAELGDLALGDVVVLDRTVGEPVALAVDRAPKPSTCTVAERDGRLNLTFLAS